jgi:hypothetical protein
LRCVAWLSGRRNLTASERDVENVVRICGGRRGRQCRRWADRPDYVRSRYFRSLYPLCRVHQRVQALHIAPVDKWLGQAIEASR